MNIKFSKSSYILIISASVAYTVLVMTILFGKRYPILDTVFRYIVSPAFWLSTLYVVLKEYSTYAGPSGRYFILSLLIYVFFLLLPASLLLLSVHKQLIGLLTRFVEGLGIQYKVEVTIMANLALAFSLAVLSCAAAEALLGYILSRVASRVDGKCIIFVSRTSRYSGFAVGGLFRGFIFITTPQGYLDDVGNGILVHERQHVEGRHMYFIYSLLINYLLTPLSLSYVHGTDVYIYIAYMPFMLILLLILFRVFEVHADLAMFRRFGAKALDYLIEVLKSVYGVDSTEKAPLTSRLTHTGRRDITLRFGDAIAPHAPWEFPLVASLLTAGILASTFVNFLSLNPHLQFLMEDFGIQYVYLIALNYAVWVLGAFSLSIILGLVFKPLAKMLLGGLLTDRGIFNLVTLMSSIYIAITSLGLRLSGTLPYMMPTIAAALNFLVVRHYVGSTRRSVYTVLSTYVVFIAISLIVMLIVRSLGILAL